MALADDLKAGDVPANLTAQKANIRNRFPEWLKLEGQIDAAIDKHVKPLRDELKKLKQNLKTDSGIDLEDIKLSYKQWARQEYAKGLDEAADRERILENLRTLHAALAEGGMLDFIDALDEAA